MHFYTTDHRGSSEVKSGDGGEKWKGKKQDLNVSSSSGKPTSQQILASQRGENLKTRHYSSRDSFSRGNASLLQRYRDAVKALQSSAKSRRKLDPKTMQCVVELLQAKRKMNMISLSICLYSLRIYSINDVFVRELLLALVHKVSKCAEPLDAQAVGNALYGLQSMSSESREVRDLLVVLRDQVGKCKEPLSAQHVGNALYGLQSMSSESREVRDLLVVLRDQVGKCREPLSAQAVGNALYGLLYCDLDASWDAFMKNVLYSLSQYSGSDSLVDAGTVLQSLCLVTCAKPYPLSDSIKDMGMLDEIVQQKNRLAEVFGTHPEVISGIGATVNRSERKYFLAASEALRDISGVTVSSNEYIEGFEADIVIRKQSSSSSSSIEESHIKKEKSTIVNVELDGPVHKHNLTKKRFCEARDRYLVDSMGVRVVRWELMSIRGLTNEQIREKFRELVCLYVPDT